MKCSSEHKLKIKLTLNKEEANWLRDLTRNYSGGRLEDEPEDESHIRLELFDTLNTHLKRED